MNVELLRKVKDHILQEPRRLRMSSWIRPSQESPCGTVACIAGWTFILTKVDVSDKNIFPAAYVAETALYNTDVQSICEYARKELEISLTQANRLFHVPGWPRKFQDRYYPMGEIEGFDDPIEILEVRAEITAEVIEDFIKKNTK